MMGNRRVTVPELSMRCIEDLDYMRKSLEPELAWRAVDFIDSETLDMLRIQDEALNAAIEHGNTRAYLTHNYRFHAILYAEARSPIMTATVDRLWLRFGPSLRVVCGRNGTMNLPDKHADLLQALTRRDRDAAKKAIAEDVDQGMIQIRDALSDG